MQKLNKIKLSELVKEVTVTETKRLVKNDKILPYNERARLYEIKLVFEDLNVIKDALGFDLKLL